MPLIASNMIGERLRLEPLHERHIAGLDAACAESADGLATIWRYLLDCRVYRDKGMAGLVRELLARQAGGTDMPFAMVDRQLECPVGVTRFMEMDLAHGVVEIGTWIGLAYQREGRNPESKRLMLRHAFCVLRAMRVQFKIDTRNVQSLQAVERMGAVREGVIRNHAIMADGSVRSSALYSILAEDWPAVDSRLARLLRHHVAA
ncbi:MAG: GNAT family N-acetyltransferase [Burkholderiales bacterium]|nr:GNAT family N-acetyltransferase [Burkholderiales bacterium]